MLCRRVSWPPSNLAPLSTTNCFGSSSVESSTPQISIFCQPPICVFLFFYMLVKNKLSQSEDKIYCHNLSTTFTKLSHGFYVVDSLNYIFRMPTKIPSTIWYSFYVVVFWKTPLYYTFCHHGSS